jgi:hypothetical protein
MRLLKILLVLQLIISLNSCGPLAYKKTEARKVSWDPDERVKKNIEDGKSFKLFDTKKGIRKATTYEFASSNELWRATLDTIDFMPLTTANYSGGIIVTDWYSDNQNLNENIKITVRFLTNEIRSDALDLKIFYRTCDTSNKCKIIEKEGNLSRELKKEILKKAVTYQQQAKDKKDKKD